MKKLMMFAAAVTIVGSAFAVDVLDYKATVNNAYLKALNITIDGTRSSITVKYKATTSLFGYLVTQCANCAERDGAGYLVVANKATKVIGILPADLLVKIWPTQFKVSDGVAVGKSTGWMAEGYLFAGAGKQAYAGVNADYTSILSASATDGGFSGLDYGASTEKIFGEYNRAALKTFADAWLDAAGFGKAVYVAGAEGDLCSEDGTPCTLLDSLSGSVIGGLFLCAQSHGEGTLCRPWQATTDVVSGTWSIKRNAKLQPVKPEDGYANTLYTGTPPATLDFDNYVNAAIKAISKTTTFDSVVPSVTAGPDFPRVTSI
jgi:hypothetical protein